MKNKNTKKSANASAFEGTGTNRSNTQLDNNHLATSNNTRTLIHFEQLEFKGMPEFSSGNTGYFDNLKIPAYLKVVANSVPYGMKNARTVETIAKLLNLTARTVYTYTHLLTAKYNLPLASITYGEQTGMFIPASQSELNAYLAQAQSRISRSQERTSGVETGFYIYQSELNKLKTLLTGGE
ncbi:hypothetical protein ACKP2L_08535 [Oenococcus alcoholitolerans]|uniref:Helix-turn-helix type 11 domain-containing protein n=1 Tax=Oenococcus alcoholitolerans TaxID=931074 RepID=A0ABR4XU87_9LACO|nr:hypothetical protein Q757_00175 [Oenococcus alcoholitolerans]